MGVERTVAVTLRRVPFGNTSLILDVYGRDTGRLSLIAKGAMRKTSPLIGLFDTASINEVLFYRHVHGRIHTLAGASHVRSFREVSAEVYRLAFISHVIEVLLALTVPEDPNPPLFDAVQLFLAEAACGDNPDVALLRFQVAALRLSGFMPELVSCTRCGKELVPPQGVYFTPYRGGIMCRDCYRVSGPFRDAVPADARLLRLLAGIASGKASVPATALLRMESLLLHFIQSVASTRLKTAPALLRAFETALRCRRPAECAQVDEGGGR